MSSSNLQIREYRATFGISGAKRALLEIFAQHRQSLQIGWMFFLRELRASVRLSFLGIFWLLAPVVANSLVWVFLSSNGIVQIADSGVPYALFAFIGNIVWTATTNSFIGGLNLLHEARGVLSKVNFPSESLAVIVLLRSSFNAVLATILLIPLLCFFPVALTWQALLLVPCILAGVVTGLAAGLLFLPVAGLISDLLRLAQLLIRFLFFLAPVVFPIPESGTAAILMKLNPVTPFLVTSRAVLIGGETPMWSSVLGLTGVAIVSLSVSLVVLKMVLPLFIERLEGT